MKNIVSGVVLVLGFMSWSAVAEEQGAMHGQATMEEKCKAMAVQHGMKGDQVDAWVKKCLEMLNQMKSGGGMGADNDMGDTNDKHDMNDDGGMGDAEDGDSGMGDETR